MLPGEGDRPIEEHRLWSNFLASTLLQTGQNADREHTKPWSVSWMKNYYAQDMPPEVNMSNSTVWAVPDIYREPLFRSLTPRFNGTKIRGVIICPLHYSSSLMGCLTIFRDEVDQELFWAGYHSPDERQMTPRQSFEAWQQTIKGASPEWTIAEIRLVHSLAERFAVAVKQFQLNQQIQALNANLERQVEIRTRELNHSTTIANQQRTLAGILSKLQKPLDMRTLFRTATHKMQQLLNVDRVSVYRFDADWGGEFVSEFGAVSRHWFRQIGYRNPFPVYFIAIRYYNNRNLLALWICSHILVPAVVVMRVASTPVIKRWLTVNELSTIAVNAISISVKPLPPQLLA